MESERIRAIRYHTKAVCCALAAISLVALIPAPGLAQEEWQRLHKVSIPGIRSGAVFGHSVDFYGDQVVVGAPGGPGGYNSGSWPGRAYLCDCETGSIAFTLTASDANAADNFAWSVGMTNEFVVVGAPLATGQGTGQAYVFDATTGIELRRILASDGQFGDHFGTSVAISGDRCTIGAFGGNRSPSIPDTGAAYVYNVRTGEQLRKLVPFDGALGDMYGSAVALHGDIAVIGAPKDDDNGSGSGSAYVYNIATGERLFKLLPVDGHANNLFGQSVAIHGARAVVGAEDFNNGRRGAAYVFDLNTGAQLWKLQASDAANLDLFGVSVAVYGNRALIGARANDNQSLPDNGAAYLFDIDTGAELLKLIVSPSENGRHFGSAVAIDGTRLIVGAEGDNEQGTNTGAAYLFRGIPNLVASPDPLESSLDATFSTTNLTPGASAYLAYSVRGLGSVYFAPLNVTIDLLHPKQIGPALTTNVNGQAQWTLHVPPIANAVPIWFQVVQFENKTNVVETQIVP